MAGDVAQEIGGGSFRGIIHVTKEENRCRTCWRVNTRHDERCSTVNMCWMRLIEA